MVKIWKFRGGGGEGGLREIPSVVPVGGKDIFWNFTVSFFFVLNAFQFRLRLPLWLLN